MFKIGDHVWYILGGFKYEGIIQKKGSNVYHPEYLIWTVKLNKIIFEFSIYFVYLCCFNTLKTKFLLILDISPSTDSLIDV